MSLRIYGVARTRAFRALWIAHELGLAYEHLPVEIGDAGARTPEFLALNPNGRLPVIVDGDFVLWESLAITLYLAKKYSAGRLQPNLLEADAQTLQWSLAKNPYLLGAEFTVADLNVAAVISRAPDMDLSAWPNLKAWLMRCLGRPAACAALALDETPAEVTRRIARINRL